MLAGAVAVPAGPAFADSTPTPSATADDYGSDGQGPVTLVLDRCVVTAQQNIGAGTMALMTISPNGPSTRFRGSGETTPLPGLSLNRAHPKLPATAGFVAEILRPDSSAPRLRTAMEGGGHPASVSDFPHLPKGCAFRHPTDDSATGTTANASGTSTAPKGGVAADHEATDDGNTPLLVAGGAAAALTAGGVVFMVRRRRTATAR